MVSVVMPRRSSQPASAPQRITWPAPALPERSTRKATRAIVLILSDNSRMSSPVLVVAAHPDDEVLGCGGTIARLAREGTDVHIAILGEGETSRGDKREQADRKKLDALHAAS